jgi:hypothetical protein
MTADGSDRPPTDRDSPVGEPVVRGDPDLTGDHATDAVEFDPSDRDSLATAADTVRRFTQNTAGGDDNVFVLRGAAACAALVRGEGTYKAAAERSDATVSFIRKWSRVHDLPRPIRESVATGKIAPSAAKHIARLDGQARLHLAWAVLDHDLTVNDVRAIATAVADDTSVADALEARDVTLGELTVELPVDIYSELRRQAALGDQSLDDILEDALDTTLHPEEQS